MGVAVAVQAARLPRLRLPQRHAEQPLVLDLPVGGQPVGDRIARHLFQEGVRGEVGVII